MTKFDNLIEYISENPDAKYFLLWAIPGKSRSISMTMFDTTSTHNVDQIVESILSTIDSWTDKKLQFVFKENNGVVFLFDNREEYVLFDYTQGVIECGIH